MDADRRGKDNFARIGARSIRLHKAPQTAARHSRAEFGPEQVDIFIRKRKPVSQKCETGRTLYPKNAVSVSCFVGLREVARKWEPDSRRPARYSCGKCSSIMQVDQYCRTGNRDAKMKLEDIFRIDRAALLGIFLLEAEQAMRA